MPRIPDFNIPSVQVQPVDMPAMQGPGVAPMQNAAPEQMQQMGQGMMQFGKGMADIGMRLQDVLNDSVVAEYDNKWRNILNDEAVKFQSLQGRDAIAGYKGFQENIAKQRRDIELGLTNEAQKIAFRNMADRRMLDIDRQANFHVTKETYNFKVSETEARIQNMMDDAIDYGSKAYDPGVPPSVRMLDGTTGLISDKTVSAIVEGARKNNADAFQTRYSGLMNQARESLSFQGINPDDEQGKLLLRNLDQKLHTGVLDRMVKNNDTNSARMFLADKNLRDKVDPDYLYKVENTLATKRKEEFASDFARALFANPDLVTAQDKRNFARGAHQAGLLDNSDLTSVLQMVKTYEEEEKETKATRNVETLNLAKTWMRAQTQGMGFSSEQSVGNFVLQRSPDLYRALGEDGLTDLETWVRTGYKETTNPAHIKQLYALRDGNPSAFKSLTPMQIKDRFQLSDSDETYWLAQLNEANGAASAADNGVMTDKRRLDAQFIKEHPRYANFTESMMHTMADYRKWEANIDSEFIAEKSKPENKNLTFQQFLAKRNTEVIKDGEPVILASLESGEVGAFRIEIPNSGGKSVDVLPTDVPAFDRAKIVDAIKESNSMRWRVGTISTDANGLPVFRVHTASDGAKSMHPDWASATDEAQKLGEGFIVQQAPEIPLDERSIISELMKQVVNRGEDPQDYFSRVKRRADLGNRIKAQGASSLDEYMLRFAKNPSIRVHLPTLISDLGLEEEVKKLPESLKASYQEFGDVWVMDGKNAKADPSKVAAFVAAETSLGRYNVGPAQKISEKEKLARKELADRLLSTGIPLDDTVNLERFGSALYQEGALDTLGNTFAGNVPQNFKDRFQSVSGEQAFKILSSVAENIGVEVSEGVKSVATTALNQLPKYEKPGMPGAQDISASTRRDLASQVRSSAFRKGSIESAVANFRGTDMSQLYGPFAKSKITGAVGVQAQNLSPLGKSLVSDIQREITAVKLQEANMPTEGGQSQYLQSLNEMLEQVMQGNNSMAEMWRTKIDTESKTYKSAFLNNLSK